jgi:hypothetical protein
MWWPAIESLSVGDIPELDFVGKLADKASSRRTELNASYNVCVADKQQGRVAGRRRTARSRNGIQVDDQQRNWSQKTSSVPEALALL